MRIALLCFLANLALVNPSRALGVPQQRPAAPDAIDNTVGTLRGLMNLPAEE